MELKRTGGFLQHHFEYEKGHYVENWDFSLTLLVDVYFPHMSILLKSCNGLCFFLQGTWIKVS